MEILIQLGANKTAFIQFLLFVFSISFLTLYVYTPYFKAYDERLKKTKGADVVAKETADEAKNLSLIYQEKARASGNKISTVFEAKKNEAAKIATDLITQAKNEAEKSTKAARTEIETQKSQASAQIQTIAKEVSAQLQQKLEGGV